MRQAAIGGPLPADLTMWLTHPNSINDVFLEPESAVLCRPGRTLAVVSRVNLVGLTFHLFVGTAAPLPPAATAVWRVDPSTNRLEGPGSIWGEFRGQADAARRTYRPSGQSDDGSGRDGSRLPTHEQGITVELRSPG